MKAFTVLEMLITISIFALIVGVAFTVLTSFNQEFHIFRKIQDDRNEFYLDKSILQKDILACNSIKTYSEGFILLGHQIGQIRYRLEEGRLTRLKNQTEIEISSMNNVQIELKFKGEIMLELDMPIDRVDLFFESQEQRMNLSFFKNNGSVQEVNEFYKSERKQ